MSIPTNYQSLPGFRTVYSETELRGAIAVAEVLISNGLAPSQQSSSSAKTSVSSSTSNQTLLAANTNRKGATIWNNSTSTLFIDFGSSVTTSAYAVKLSPSFQYYEVPYGYTGVISGIWDSANGNALIRELI